MGKFRKWLILKLLSKYTLVDPVRELWKLVDEENAKEEPDCVNVEAWLTAIDRLNGKNMICICNKRKV